MKDATVEKHDSFGMVGISHTTSNGTHLVGSEFNHHNFVELTIHRAERHRDLSRDWWFGREELISIFLSEAQLVELIGRPNMGSGVPCTINHVLGESMPPAPAPEPLKDRFKADMEADIRNCTKEVREAVTSLNEAIDKGHIGKTILREIAHKLDLAAASVDRGIPFVRKSFQEEMEKVVHHDRRAPFV